MRDAAPDIRQIAEAYREVLKLQLARIDRFLDMAGEFSRDPDGLMEHLEMLDEAVGAAGAKVIYLSAYRRAASG
jgi:hypothetical protein